MAHHVAHTDTEAHYRAVIDALAEGVVSIDAHGVITQCNAAAATILGVDQATFIGSPLLGDDSGGLYADGSSMPNAEVPMLRVLRTGEAITEEIVGMFRPSGEVRWVEVSARPIVTAEGVRGVVGSFHDVTEKREQAALYRTVTAALAEGILIFDGQGTIIDCNQSSAEMLGMAQAELIGASAYGAAWGAIHEDGTPVRKHEFPAMQTLQSGQRVQDRIVGIRRDGGIAWLMVNVRPLYTGVANVVQGAVASIRDITRERANAAELESSRAQLSDLARRLQAAQEHERARLSREVHDVLGQALTALRIDLKWIQDNVYDAHANFQPRVTEAVRQAQETIETARQISRKLRPGILDHFGLVPALDWQATQFATRTGIACAFQDDTDFMLDEMERPLATALFRILQEAQTNILKHANATRVDIRLALTDDTLLLTVKDNGRGIRDAERLKRNALGLLNMRERVYPWGGEVQIAGARHEGTTVSVRIPRDRIHGIDD
ncbi:MAG: PAS domain-containing sensor histidine kinase [Bacteroidota bacterium]